HISNQVLIYPSLDYTLSLPSIRENAEGYLLDSSRVSWYFDNYFQHSENRRDVSPLHAPFIERLPRTLIVSAGFDPLRDEAIAYQARLQQAG
ncbi:MAG: alpha/beta hydrolase fold domain-containing protein, partial [Microvirgula sp.]